MADKNFIKGNWKEITFENWGSILNLNLRFEDLEKLPREKGYIRLTVWKRKEKDEYWNTHYIYENDYKKETTDEKKVKDEKYWWTDSSQDLPFSN